MLLCSASGISAICSNLTKNITTRLVRTYRCTRMRRSRVPSRLTVARWRRQFWADCTTNISERKFPTGTPVAIAEFQQPARAIEAQPFDDIARPTAAVTFLCQAPLGREHATMAHGGHVTLEVGLAAEQPEPVLDFPLDARRTGGFFSARARSPPQHENTTRKARTKTGSIASAAINRGP